MAENYIDYEVVEASAQSYSQQAEALGAVLQALAGTNDALQGGFKNQTATAFIERYDSEYKVAIQCFCLGTDFLNNFHGVCYNHDRNAVFFVNIL